MGLSYLITDPREATAAADQLAGAGHRFDWLPEADGIRITLDQAPSVEVEQIIIATAPTARRLDLD